MLPLIVSEGGGSVEIPFSLIEFKRVYASL